VRRDRLEQDGNGVTVLDGHAVVWSEPLRPSLYEGRVPSLTCAVCESPSRV